MVTILGIRHHGVGSAQQVKAMLEQLQPDCILIEGAPEITPLLSFIGNENLVPPVAIMLHDVAMPQRYTFYPFVAYSPEWVAANYAYKHQIPISGMDMPAIYFLDEEKESETTPVEQGPKFFEDPLLQFAKISGYDSIDDWWDYYFENGNTAQTPQQHFDAVHLSMDIVRKETIEERKETLIREAFMRQQISAAINKMHQNIVVVCGAYHRPALLEIDKYAKVDAKLLKQLPKSKVKIRASWIPWTNDRMAKFSGYGAGISAPAWYHHLWKNKKEITTTWLVRTANKFRKKNIDISSAHIIEAQRLSYTLAALRGKHCVGLQELNDATLSVMCLGDAAIFNLIKYDLLVENKIGKLPDDIPKLPIQEDFELSIKKLRLPIADYEKLIELDLRKEQDLRKSEFLHRLALLNNPFATLMLSKSKGTFKESWNLCYSPSVEIALIDQSYLGNTIENACTQFIKTEVKEASSILHLATILHQLIPASLFDVFNDVLKAVEDQATLSNDIIDLLKALDPMIAIIRYGNVRKTDTAALGSIVANLVVKATIGLPNACYGLDEDKSMEIGSLIHTAFQKIKLLEDDYLSEAFQNACLIIFQKANYHPIINGSVGRLVVDNDMQEISKIQAAISFHLSANQLPEDVAYWLQGFLYKSGSILLYDEKLWNLLYDWVAQLATADFDILLPFLRRTFSTFEYAERRSIGQKAKHGLSAITAGEMLQEYEFDEVNALKIIPTITKLMGLKIN